MSANLNALLAAQNVIEKVMRNIGDSLARSARGLNYGPRGETAQAEPRGQVISVAFNRQL